MKKTFRKGDRVRILPTGQTGTIDFYDPDYEFMGTMVLIDETCRREGPFNNFFESCNEQKELEVIEPDGTQFTVTFTLESRYGVISLADAAGLRDKFIEWLGAIQRENNERSMHMGLHATLINPQVQTDGPFKQ